MKRCAHCCASVCSEYLMGCEFTRSQPMSVGVFMTLTASATSVYLVTTASNLARSGTRGCLGTSSVLGRLASKVSCSSDLGRST